MSRSALAILVLALSAAPTLGAQGTPPTAADSTRAALASARSDLRNLITVQEMYFANNTRYASTMEQLAKLYVPNKGNTIRLVNAEANAWSAVLSSVLLKGTCTIFVGLDTAKAAKTALDKRVGEEGLPVCDRQPGETPPPATVK